MARLAAMKRQSEWFSHFFDAAYVAQLREEKSPADTRAEVDFLVRCLGLPRGARILDVPCGYGRHAAALARRGFVVLGLDLSRAMIAEGRRRFTEGPRLRLRRADMRRIAFPAEFDAVVNLYTSFGYFEPAENQAVLRRMARALKPGGRLVVDHRDPVYDATLPRRLWYRAGPRRFILEDRRFDRRTGIVDTVQLVLTTGRRRVVQRRFRLQEFSLSRWRRMLRRAGLRLLGAYAGYDGRRYRPGSTGRLIVVAERPLPSRRKGPLRP
ncbi:MAG TPA: class I SAM-dependent methyltransferase [Methylomirabilota bacterium]|nr:class I SAM-dependent methyltransferase [Methylomirabilota bacterium]